MSDLMSSNLVKIIVGIAVAVIVIGGVAIFFGDKVIDFFKGMPDFGEGVVEESQKSRSFQIPEPEPCESCGILCTKSKCKELNEKWILYLNLLKENFDEEGVYCEYSLLNRCKTINS